MDIHCVTRNLGRRSLAQTWVDGLALAGVHLIFGESTRPPPLTVCGRTVQGGGMADQVKG